MNRLPWDACKPWYDALGIKFNPAQEPIIKGEDRFPVIGGGERGGKTFVTAAILLPHVVMLPYIKPDRFLNKDGSIKFDYRLEAPRNPDLVLFGPTYAEPRIEFAQLESWLRILGKLPPNRRHLSKPQEGPWRMVTTDGVVITTWSMDDPASIRAFDVEMAAVCEAGRAPYSGIERVQGRISNKRAFCVYSGTMENSQQWYQDWMLIGKRQNHLGVKSYSLPTYSNLHEFPGGREDPEIKRLEAFYPEDVFAMRVLAEPRPPRDRVLQEVKIEHVQECEVPPDALVEIFVDPGYSSAYAVLFVAMWDEYEMVTDPATGKESNEFKHKRFHVFDELYEQGLTTYDMVQLSMESPYWPRIRSGVIDIGAKAHRDSGESALENWQKQARISFNMRYWPEQALIERIRSSAKIGQITIDPKCKGLLAECGLGEPVFPNMHHWKYPTDRDGRITGEKPLDKWNHAAKALGYGLLHHIGKVEVLRRRRSFNRLSGMKPRRNIFSAAA